MSPTDGRINKRNLEKKLRFDITLKTLSSSKMISSVSHSLGTETTFNTLPSSGDKEDLPCVISLLDR